MASSRFASAPKKSFLRTLLTLVMWGGVSVALWPLAQKGYGWWSQRQLMAGWNASAPASPAQKVKTQKVATKAQNQAREAARAVTLPVQNFDARTKATAAWPATRLRIPDIGVDAIVVQGLDEKALARGPGHDPRSVLPGQSGNCVLAGHRNVYGAWFYRVDELQAGSQIELENSRGRSIYQVISVSTVSESDYTVLRSDPNAPPQLTLITCTLPHSPNRIIVTAQIGAPM